MHILDTDALSVIQRGGEKSFELASYLDATEALSRATPVAERSEAPDSSDGLERGITHSHLASKL